MAFSENYRRQVALLLRTIPFIAKEKCFALKGGTAINLFVRDLPRLSVDIDLTYVPIYNRSKSLGAIDKAMKRIAVKVEKGLKGSKVNQTAQEGSVTKLVVREAGTQIKIEVTPVLRGCAYEPELRSVSAAVEDMFGFAEMQVVSFADLYAGKIMAALDRQHPRDLFDVRDLLANEGIDDALRSAFVVYLLSHNRPMAEVLGAAQKDISDEFVRNFEGMTEHPVTKEDLVATRTELVDLMIARMPARHKHFLVSFEAGQPDWSLLDVPKAAKLPAVQWRMKNLDGIAQNKRIDLVKKLGKVLSHEVPAAQYTLFAEKQKTKRKTSGGRSRK
ncbi:MAG: nucleotidyl transferase AbiEii/AbiGii toxin family protein [Hyphomicrobium sp.]